MKIRPITLWRVPVYCAAASWIGYYLTAYIGGFFFTAKTVGADGVISVSVDPLRSAIFNGALFVSVLLTGGLWVFRSMTKAEIAVSAAIASAIYLALVLAQLYLPDFPISISVQLAKIQNWTGILLSFLLKVGGNFNFSAVLANLAPLLFIPFGRKSNP